MSKPRNIDQRKARRLRYGLHLDLSWPGGSTEAYTTNISLVGAFVETRQMLSPGTGVRLTFQTITRGMAANVVAEGRVVRRISFDELDSTRPHPGLAVQFQRFESGKQALAGVLEALRLAQKYSRKSERRVEPRAPVGLPVFWGPHSRPTQSGIMTNFSGSGCFLVHTEMPGDRGSQIYLHFQLPVEGEVMEVRAVATVIRVVEDSGSCGMGVAFELSTVDVSLIQRFMSR